MTFAYAGPPRAGAHPARSSCCAPSTADGTEGGGVRRWRAFGAQGGSTPAAVPRRRVPASRRVPGGRSRRADPGGHRRDDPRPGSAAGHDRRPAPGGHGHPRLRHLGQHGRHRPQADPDGRRGRSRDRLRPCPAGQRRHRCRRLQRFGIAVQQPTNDQDAVIAALDRLRPQRGTSLARGIDASLAAIARAAADRPSTTTPTARPSRRPRRRPSRRGSMPRPSSCS
jgi:hypothetical protein